MVGNVKVKTNKKLKEEKKFPSRKAVEEHWANDCEAFFFYCPDCGN